MITVDWSIGASPINYITARNRVQDHARWVAEFIDFLHLNNFVRFEELHAIGHSLGGQMVGLIGKAVTRGRIQVIYPLDPGKIDCINVFLKFIKKNLYKKLVRCSRSTIQMKEWPQLTASM